MASDEIIWNIINQQFCSFKLTTTKQQSFCRNEYNSTGFCNRQSCPLANSRYATVRSHPTKDVLYLYIKTIERAHLPSKLWERTKLSSNYAKALEQIDEKLLYFPKFQIHKAKQRLTRLTQVAIRARRIAAEEERLGEKLVPKLAPKIRHREAARGRKAEAAAKNERTIRRELLERLRQGAYGDQPLNVSEAVWAKVLKALEREGQGIRDKDKDKGIEVDEDGNRIEDEEEEEVGGEEELELEREEDEGQVEYVSDLEESDDELGDIEDWLGSDVDDDDESAEDDDDDDDEDDDDNDGESGDQDDERGDEVKKKKRKKLAAGDKRKRGRVVRMAAKKRNKQELEKEVEGAVHKMVDF